ncbi:hypothetical protein N2152v2_005686 [Parachlorella kessleri]
MAHHQSPAALKLTHATPEQAAFYLEASGDNFNRAITMFFEQHPASPTQRARPHPPDVPPRPRAPAIHARAPQHGGGGIVLPAPVGAVLALPFTVITAGFGLVFRVINLSASVASIVLRQILPRPVFNALTGAARAIQNGSRELDPTASAQAFVAEWRERYGGAAGGSSAASEGPHWLECGWQEATNRATAEGKFLLVYLHAWQHQDTEAFCRGTLSDPQLVEYIHSTLLCWGGDLRHSDAFRLSSSLRAAAYPYLGLLAFSGARTRLVTCIEGRMAPSQVLTLLQQAVAENAQLLWQEQAERQQREFDRRLREEQDAEYQRSLEADRQREQAREEERQAAEAAEKAQREAEERERAEREAEERRKAEAEAALAARKAAKAAALPPEPAAGTPGTTLIRLRLPTGANHQRRFRAEDPMQVVYDYADSLPTLNSLKYSLATAFPRRVYGTETLQQPLSSLDLVPQGVLLVQPEDD